MTVFEHQAPVLLIWLAVLGAAAATVYGAWRGRGLFGVFLAALRLGFLGLLAWCLLQPQHKSVWTRVRKPKFVVALDRSASMTLGPDPEASNRWQVARQVLRLPWARVVAAECDLDVYGFADELGSVPGLEEAVGLSPGGGSTLFRDALKTLAARYRGQNVAGVLALSDGVDTREAYDDWAGDPWPWPIYSVRLEESRVWEVEPDVRVESVTTPQRVNVGWRSELSAVVSGRGTGGRPLNIRLYRNGGLMQERPTQLPEDGGARTVAFPLEHRDTGVFTYEVRVPPLARETHTNDNAYALSVQVVDSRNRVLYVEGPPRWESKYLNRALGANREISLVSFLRGPAGRFLTLGARGDFNTDMTPEQLAWFKIVIVGDLDASELGEGRAANLVRFTETGGSLVLLGGSRAWSAAGFDKGPLRELLPMRPLGGAALEGRFPVVRTDTGTAHPAFAGKDRFWAALPPVLSVFRGDRPAAGAEVLLEAATPAGSLPLVLVQRYGQGRVVCILTDSLWRWQLDPEAGRAEPYRRFWDQLTAWLLPAEREIEEDQIDLFVDRDKLFLGEEVRLSARLGIPEEEMPTGVRVQCEIETPGERRIPFGMDPRQVVTSSGRSFPGFSLAFEVRGPGLHTAQAVAEVAGREVRSDPVSFFVKPFTPESVPRPANVRVLRLLARSSGGRFCETPGELDHALSALRTAGAEEENVRYRSLWQTRLVLACLLALLTIEWGARKWRSLP